MLVHSQGRLTNTFAFNNVTLSMWKTTKQLTSRRRQNINLKAFGNLEIIVWARFVCENCCSLNLHKYSLACQPGNMVTHRKDRSLSWLWGVGSTRGQKIWWFCAVCSGRVPIHSFGVICGIECGNSQHFRMLQMTLQFLIPSEPHYLAYLAIFLRGLAAFFKGCCNMLYKKG